MASIPPPALAEFWSRYAAYLEAAGDMAAAGDAIQRASARFCKVHPAAHLAAAALHERRGDAAAARAALALVTTKLAPNSIAALLATAGFERRQGDAGAARAAFAGRVEAARGGADKRLFAFLVMQYAQFLAQALGDAAEARKVRRACR